MTSSIKFNDVSTIYSQATTAQEQDLVKQNQSQYTTLQNDVISNAGSEKIQQDWNAYKTTLGVLAALEAQDANAPLSAGDLNSLQDALNAAAAGANVDLASLQQYGSNSGTPTTSTTPNSGAGRG